MGCLVGLVKKIIIIALIIAFFIFGGWELTKQKINDYKNPPRDEFIQTESDYGDFSGVSSDYQLTRSFNIFGYKKINAKYLPTGQKITIFDLKDETKLCENDFETKEIDEKINNILGGLKDSFITYENFQITKRGKYYPKNKTIPYIVYKANVKNIPFKTVVGVVAVYSTQNKKAKHPSTKLIISTTDKKAYNYTVMNGFVSALKF